MRAATIALKDVRLHYRSGPVLSGLSLDVSAGEPLTNLDAVLRRGMLSLLRELLTERGATAIYVTHDLREAASLGDRIAVLSDGRIAQNRLA